MATLILGAPGSGKSYLASWLQRNKIEAFDADYDIPNLAGWFNSHDEKVVFPAHPTLEWLNTHTFKWDESVLKNFLLAHEDVFICGIASNAFGLSSLFEQSFYLMIDKELLRNRLLFSDRKNARGKTEAEVEQIARDIETEHLPAVKKHNVHIMDGAQSPEEIFVAIKKYILASR